MSDCDGCCHEEHLVTQRILLQSSRVKGQLSNPGFMSIDPVCIEMYTVWVVS